MNKLALLIVFVVTAGILSFWFVSQRNQRMPEVSKPQNKDMIPLPEPKLKSELSLEEAILKRRSQREFQDKQLTFEQLSQILWVAQGVTDEKTGFRAAPSAGALYPLEIYIVIGSARGGSASGGKSGVEELERGIYHYIPDGHKLEVHLAKDVKNELYEASLSQEAVLQAPVSLVIAAEYERTTVKYGERGIRYVWLEAGHAAQNVYLKVTALGLGTVTIGAFNDDVVTEILDLPENFQLLYIMPIGFPK